MPTEDIFRPRNEPARSIYDAFQDEATKRKGRTVEEWLSAERSAVFTTACELAVRFRLRPPTLKDVEMAESCARGHIDYGAKWAYYVTEAMQPKT